jgi:hypothetical protein
MNHYKYRWIWTDQEDIYTNIAHSLDEIIKEIVDYYFGEDVCFFYCDRKENDETGDTFSIHFVEAGITHEYTIGANPYDVAQFLDELAEECERPDSFHIDQIKN